MMVFPRSPIQKVTFLLLGLPLSQDNVGGWGWVYVCVSCWLAGQLANTAWLTLPGIDSRWTSALSLSWPSSLQFCLSPWNTHCFAFLSQLSTTYLLLITMSAALCHLGWITAPWVSLSEVLPHLFTFIFFKASSLNCLFMVDFSVGLLLRTDFARVVSSVSSVPIPCYSQASNNLWGLSVVHRLTSQTGP